jgi:DNA (cytosine-5)-methyltransferase 1
MRQAIERLASADAFFARFDDSLKIPGRGPRFADFFAGCGGLSKGFSQAGFSLVFSNEKVGQFAETSYVNHSTPAESYYVGDIADLYGSRKGLLSRLGKIDVVCGGPPCQGFSTANRQRLIDDPRNRLYKDYLSVLAILRPRFFVIENVRGMAARIDDIARDIAEHLGPSYRFDYSFLNAVDFGIPQNRQRFFLVANRIGVPPERVFAELRTMPHRGLGEALAGLPELGTNPYRNRSRVENDTVGYKLRRARLPMPNEYLRLINGARPAGTSALDATDWVLNHRNRFNNDRDIEIFRRLPPGGDSLHESIRDIMPYKSRDHMFKDKYYRLREDAPCKTITSHMKFDCNMYIHPRQSRGLSAREAARVQSFPDDYFLRGAPNHWYTQVGNAVPVLLGRALAESIQTFL